MNNFHAFVSLQLLPPVPAKGHLPMGMAAGGSWADMKTSVQFSCPLPREMWLQQVIPLFKLVTQRSDILTLGCRKACKKKKPVSDFVQMALAAWHGWMSGFPWETKSVCTIHLLSLIPKHSWGKRGDFRLSQWLVLKSISLISWGSLDGHWDCLPWSAWSMQSGTCPWTLLHQSSPESPQGLQCTAWARGGFCTFCTLGYTYGCPHATREFPEGAVAALWGAAIGSTEDSLQWGLKPESLQRS